MSYNPWPLGKIPVELQRPELYELQKNGYVYNDARDVIDIFESKLANYAGSKYAVTVDNCTDALFLCLKYANAQGDIRIPKHTYISVPQSIIHAGCRPIFEDRPWSGPYALLPYNIYDGAVRFTRGMYIQNSLHCLSFQIKKVLPIGKGGAILTNSPDACNWLKRARYEGRDITKKYDEDELEFIGWNMYMTPEDAARGILLMDKLPLENKDMADWSNYPDLTKQRIFQ